MKKLFLLSFILFFMTIRVQADSLYEKVELDSCVNANVAKFKIASEIKLVRFLAISTSEQMHNTQIGQMYASQYVCSLLTNNKDIVLEYDDANILDEYNQQLAWIWLDGTLLQEKLVNSGFAEVINGYENAKYTSSLCLHEDFAKNSQYGIWIDPFKQMQYCHTLNYREVQNNIKYEYKEEKVEDNSENIVDSLEKIESNLNEINKYTEENQKQITSVLFYIFLAVGFVVVLKNELK